MTTNNELVSLSGNIDIQNFQSRLAAVQKDYQ